MTFFSTEIQSSLAASADRFRAASSTELVASWKPTISAPISSMSLARFSRRLHFSKHATEPDAHTNRPAASQQDPERHATRTIFQCRSSTTLGNLPGFSLEAVFTPLVSL